TKLLPGFDSGDVYSGVLGSVDTEKKNFELFVGRRPTGNIRAQFSFDGKNIADFTGVLTVADNVSKKTLNIPFEKVSALTQDRRLFSLGGPIFHVVTSHQSTYEMVKGRITFGQAMSADGKDTRWCSIITATPQISFVLAI